MALNYIIIEGTIEAPMEEKTSKKGNKYYKGELLIGRRDRVSIISMGNQLSPGYYIISGHLSGDSIMVDSAYRVTQAIARQQHNRTQGQGWHNNRNQPQGHEPEF